MTAPRSLAELRNVIYLLREATSILDLEQSLRHDPDIQALADDSFDLLCGLRDRYERMITETGFGGFVNPSIEIRNVVEV